MRLFPAFFLVLILSGCASMNSLPQSAADVDFADIVEGKTGWSEYQGQIELPKLDDRTAYEAAKAGLRSARFTVARADFDSMAVIGQHGMTAYDWNVVAGVYIQTDANVTRFKVLVEGSKDIGFSGDATGADWVGHILAGVQNYLGATAGGNSGGASSTSSGTCFVVTPDGHAITNNHVVDGGREIKLRLSDGREFAAAVQSRSTSTDLALLKIDATELAYLSLGDARSERVGAEVFTVGYPVTAILGDDIKFTDGVISSLSGIGGEMAFMQITVPIQPGNSGGPLVNDNGNVVGVTTSTAAVGTFLKHAGTLPQNINWAVKAEYAALMFEQPPARPATTDRQQAIDRAIEAACRVVVLH